MDFPKQVLAALYTFSAQQLDDRRAGVGQLAAVDCTRNDLNLKLHRCERRLCKRDSSGPLDKRRGDVLHTLHIALRCAKARGCRALTLEDAGGLLLQVGSRFTEYLSGLVDGGVIAETHCKFTEAHANLLTEDSDCECGQRRREACIMHTTKRESLSVCTTTDS
eukprot:7690692-Pyramimonas_sp.AAC.1